MEDKEWKKKYSNLEFECKDIIVKHNKHFSKELLLRVFERMIRENYVEK